MKSLASLARRGSMGNNSSISTRRTSRARLVISSSAFMYIHRARNVFWCKGTFFFLWALAAIIASVKSMTYLSFQRSSFVLVLTSFTAIIIITIRRQPRSTKIECGVWRRQSVTTTRNKATVDGAAVMWPAQDATTQTWWQLVAVKSFGSCNMCVLETNKN